ncbi:MAG: hypothetical protein WKF35_12360 [Ferruginibacter sp.]
MRSSSNKDSVLAITLLLLLFFFYSKNIIFIYSASAFVIICLLSNDVADIFDKIWKKLTEILGLISSTIILSVLFFLFVFPLGLILKALNKSPLMLHPGERKTTFVEEKKLFTQKDFQNPF